MRLPALILALAAVSFCATAREPDADEKRAELKALKARIDGLRRQVLEAEESRSETADQLKEAEEAISAANRSLRELGQEKAALGREMAQINVQSRQLEQGIGEQQAALGKLLHRHYVAGEADQLRHLLSGADPNAATRDLYFLKSLSRSQAELIAGLRGDLRRKRELAQTLAAKGERLAAVERAQQQERAALVAQQDKRRSVLARIASTIQAQRREIETLKRNEKRLARIIDGLARIIARPADKAPERRAPAPSRNEVLPEPFQPAEAFGKLKGRLRLPARGELITRFGAPKHEGGGSSKGLFIRADTGAEVKAIAAARVVFAEWLRGFGNLIILDHGDDYLSVYGNNEALFKNVGQAVGPGETIASIGASGGSPESGLYFELRFQGQPIDPMRWVNPR